MNIRHLAVAAFSVAGTLFMTSGQAEANLVTNGDFSQTTNGAGELGYNTNATGWSTTGYNFLFTPGSADTTGANGSYGNVQLWGPNNGSANGLPAASPAGGNFVALDGDFITSPLSQTINGLTAGQTYDVGFYFSYSQQSGFTGPTNQSLSVSLGSDSDTLSNVVLPSEGFSGWSYADVQLKADGTSDVLSFLAFGNSAPPFALVSGVSVSAVPLPGALPLFGSALVGIGVFVRRRTQKKAAVAKA